MRLRLKINKRPSSKFLKINCPKCGHAHTVFGKASTKIKCNKCNAPLTKRTGGKTKVKAPVKEVIWN